MNEDKMILNKNANDNSTELEQMKTILEQSKIMSDTYLKGQKTMAHIVYACLGVTSLIIGFLIMCLFL